MQKLKESIAFQLFDHEESPSGIKQPRFHTWGEDHIDHAVVGAADYLFTLLPDEFAKVVSFKTEDASCVIETPTACAKLLKVLSIGGDECKPITESAGNSEDLSGLLALGGACLDSQMMPSTYEALGGGLLRTDKPVPACTKIELLCATPPESGDVASIPDRVVQTHRGFIVNWALWHLLNSDNESKSNMERVTSYFGMMRAYVTETLLLEFSLREDDYEKGRRKVDDRG